MRRWLRPNQLLLKKTKKSKHLYINNIESIKLHK